MIEKIKQINFRKPKYILPAICFFPVLYVVWMVCGFFTMEIKDDAPTSVDGAVNVDMPDPNMNNLGLKSKYANLVDNFYKDTDYSAVMKLDDEVVKVEDNSSLYTEAEIQVLDSLEEKRKADIQMLADLQRNVESNIAGRSKTTQDVKGESGSNELMKQMQLIQKVANGEKILTPEEEEEQRFQERLKKMKEEELSQKVLNDAPEIVEKAQSSSKNYFNTLHAEDDDDNNYIKAMLDEKIKVVDGSRIRVRLLDDIMIGEYILAKGTYLYATISGFGSQRVKAKVESIIIGGERIKVSLMIYDNDGLEGFYVPASAFRDLTKDASSQAMSQNITMNSSTDQDLEAFALQALQSAYSSTTSAISNNIKKNKAKLKYNTVVYLINE